MISSAFGSTQDVPLLRTKLYIPSVRPHPSTLLRTRLVSRPRLIERLNAGFEPSDSFARRLTLISAPAGFGKTTLVSEWIGASESRLHVAWLSLDEGDNDPLRFWRYVIAALQTIAPSLGLSAQAVLEAQRGAVDALPSQLPRLEALVTALINDVAAASQEALRGLPCVLVLDDYQVIETESIHASLNFLLDHLPPQWQLVVTTRAEPPLSLARLRARGQLTELRAADLTFTGEEAAVFLNEVMGLDLSDKDVAALKARTEGWIAGLQLAAIALQSYGLPDKHDFVTFFAGDDRYVVDYLVAEVLQRQPPHVQTFLLRTSILDRLCGPLCDAMTGQAGSQTILLDLERLNLFIVPLDNRRHWYRYHHLFADLLRNRLEGEVGAGDLVTLHLRASRWYESEGFAPQAIAHALAAADYERTADLVEQPALAAISRGELTLARRWMEAIPENIVRSRPLLCVAYAWIALSRSMELAEQWIKDAETALSTTSYDLDEPDSPGRAVHDLVAANVLALRVSTARQRGESHTRIIELCHEALNRIPEGNADLRSTVALWMGIAYQGRGDQDAANRAFDMARQIGEASEGYVAALVVAGLEAYTGWDEGRLHDAAAVCRKALRSIVEPAERAGRRLPMACYVYVILGKILLQWNDLEEAESFLRRGLELSELTAEPPVQADGYCALARLRGIQGNFKEALALMDKAERTLSAWSGEPGFVPALRVRLWLRQAWVEGNPRYLDLALEWAEEQKLESTESHRLELQSLAQVRVAQRRAYGEPDLAPLLCVLNEQLRLVEAANAPGWRVEVLVLKALALQAQGQSDRAMAPLERSLSLARQEAFTRHLLDYGPPMEELLRQAVARGMAVEYASKLLAALGKEVKAPSREPATEQPPSSVLVEALSPRELEVLQLIATGASNPEIAQELYITVNTVKKHVTHIFGKLGVTSRTWAVARARELGLVE